MHILIVGGGWAGLSAAVQAVQRGWQVTLVEATRQLGGRARTLDHEGLRLDNGQHILIGAYTETLCLMRTVGVDLQACLHRAPLSLTRPDGHGLQLPAAPPPWNLLGGVLCASGWTWQDRLSLIRQAWQWQRQGFACPERATVADLCVLLTPRVMDQLIAPLCVSALNTPTHLASGAVFLRVLRDALYAGSGASDVLLPTTDLGALMPEVAATWLQQHGADVRLGHRWSPASSARDLAPPEDALVLACPAWEAARLTAEHHPAWSAQAQALPHAAIATVYVQHTDSTWAGLPAPMMALPHAPRRPAQFVFDRGYWLPAQRGLLACVVSDSQGTREQLEQQVLEQLSEQLAGLVSPAFRQGWRVVQTVVEKRATFVCTPGLQRPDSTIGPGWWACGDYVQGPYPATLEGAVRSGREVIDQIAQRRERQGRL